MTDQALVTLAQDVRLLAESIPGDDVKPIDESDLSYALELRAVVRAAAADLKALSDALDTQIGSTLGGDAQVFPGVGKVKRHPRVSRRNWQSDDLFRVVMDSRVVDPETGEIKDETPVEKIQAVYPCKGYNARTTALLERGIDPDEYAESQWVGWSLEVRK